MLFRNIGNPKTMGDPATPRYAEINGTLSFVISSGKFQEDVGHAQTRITNHYMMVTSHTI